MKEFKGAHGKWHDVEFAGTYTEKELIEFGNYLLSEERKESIIHPQVENSVNDADVQNWKDKK